MTYGELSESQARRSRQFAEAQTNAMSVYCDAERDLKELQAENAKLQDLVHDLLQLILADGFDCYGCVYKDCNGMQYTDRCKLLDRACKLGVEVDA